MNAPEDFTSFKNRHESGKSQLVTRWLPADLDTPVSAFLKLAHGQPYAFLLESVEGGATLGRYSIIGLHPDIVWTCEKGKPVIRQPGKQGEEISDDPLSSLRALLHSSRLDHIPENSPPMAASGLFGMMGYDMVRLVEHIPDKNPDPLSIPDAVMMRPTVMVIFDNVTARLCLATPVYENKETKSSQSAQQVFDAAHARLQDVVTRLSSPLPQTSHDFKTPLPLAIQQNFSQDAFEKAVKTAIEYIAAGEIFQVVPSLRFAFDFDAPAFALYRSLRRLNPSPFLFYFNFEGFQLVGSSPEILVRVRQGTVTIRPIAGTRRRGNTAQEDSALSQDLLSDPKERAEHLMLLDLGRNDIGRVAETGTVKVTEQFAIEHYSHVMHIVSNVEGRLRRDVDTLDALFAGFPAGTVSGAPKIRAMEIIDELEPVKRKFYAGCVGYLSANGEMDTCIALRTALVKDGKVYVQAGAGIVADSSPVSEYQECWNKAKAIIQAAEDVLKQPA